MVTWWREACIPAVTWRSKAIFVTRGASLSNISPWRELGPRRIFRRGSWRTSFGPWALPNPLGSPCKRLIMEGRGVQSTRRLARIDQPDRNRNRNRSVMTGPTPLTGRWRVPIFITQPRQVEWQFCPQKLDLLDPPDKISKRRPKFDDVRASQLWFGHVWPSFT